MRNLALISLVVLSLGCSQQPYLHLSKQEDTTPCLTKLKPNYTTVLYNAQVNVTGKHLSGLLLFKTMEDSSERVIFTNEMGVTFFDFEFRKDRFKVISCVKQMNKKVVINRLKQDLGLLLIYGYKLGEPEAFKYQSENYYSFVLKNERVYYVTDTACTRISRIETASKEKKKIIVNMTGNGSGMPDSVYLAHQSFEYNITLKKIVR